LTHFNHSSYKFIFCSSNESYKCTTKEKYKDRNQSKERYLLINDEEVNNNMKFNGTRH